MRASLRLQEAHRKNEAFYASEKSPVTEALDRWFGSYFLPQVDGEPQPDTRDLDPILEEFSDRVALVIAKRVEAGDPRLSEGRISLGSRTALRHLGHRAAPAVPILLRSLRQIRNSSPVDWTRFNGAMAMLREVSVSSIALDDLLSLVAGPESYLVLLFSVEPLTAIVRGGGADVFPRLSTFLTHSDPHTRLAASVTMSHCFEPSEAAIRVIRECLEKAEPEALNFVLQDLKRMNGDKSVYLPQLIALLRHPRPTIAGTAVRTIGEMGKPALPAILKLLNDDELSFRKFGTTALYNYVATEKRDPTTWSLVESVISSIARDDPLKALWILEHYSEEGRPSSEVADVLKRLAESPETRIKAQAKRLLPKFPASSATLR